MSILFILYQITIISERIYSYSKYMSYNTNCIQNDSAISDNTCGVYVCVTE